MGGECVCRKPPIEQGTPDRIRAGRSGVCAQDDGGLDTEGGLGRRLIEIGSCAKVFLL